MNGCNRCMGEGFIVVCVDDICRGLGECIHGDGEAVCPDCDGDGEVWDEDYEYQEAQHD